MPAAVRQQARGVHFENVVDQLVRVFLFKAPPAAMCESDGMGHADTLCSALPTSVKNKPWLAAKIFSMFWNPEPKRR